MSGNSPINNDGVIRSFGRIKGRKLSNHKETLLSELFLQYQVDDNNSKSNKNILEIGFGFGDFLFEKAKNNPQATFYGFEPHINGVVNILARLEKEPLNNIKLSKNDVREFLEKIEDEFFDEILILFPDPWPKLKHFKRRLLTQEFFDSILAPKLKDSGKITIATDHDSYKTWILAEILKSKKIHWPAKSKKDWKIFPDDWTVTKYHLKAKREGRVSVIFNLIKK